MILNVLYFLFLSVTKRIESQGSGTGDAVDQHERPAATCFQGRYDPEHPRYVKNFCTLSFIEGKIFTALSHI